MRCAVLAALLMSAVVAVQDPPAPEADARAPHTVRCVAAFRDLEALARFRKQQLPLLEIHNYAKGFRRLETVVEFDVTSRLPEQRVLERLRKQPEILAVSKVLKHRFSLVVEFDRAMTTEAATRKLKDQGVLLVRIPGKRKESTYFEVIVETDSALEKLLGGIRKIPGVVVAEFNFEYRQDQKGDGVS